LIPILQQVGEFRGGQRQLRIQGNPLNLLFFPRPIDRPSELKETKYRQILPGMQGLQASDLLTVWQHQKFSFIAIPEQLEEQPQGQPPHLKDSPKYPFFHDVCRLALRMGLLHKFQHLFDSAHQFLAAIRLPNFQLAPHVSIPQSACVR
jgi:hypothetical protein